MFEDIRPALPVSPFLGQLLIHLLLSDGGVGGRLPSAATVSLRHSLSLSISFSGHRELHLTFNPLKYNSVGFGPFL